MLFKSNTKSIFFILILLLHYKRLNTAEVTQTDATAMKVAAEHSNNTLRVCFAHIRRRGNFTFCYYCCSAALNSRICYCDLVAMDYCRQDWLPVLRKLPKFSCRWDIQAYS